MKKKYRFTIEAYDGTVLLYRITELDENISDEEFEKELDRWVYRHVNVEEMKE